MTNTREQNATYRARTRELILIGARTKLSEHLTEVRSLLKRFPELRETTNGHTPAPEPEQQPAAPLKRPVSAKTRAKMAKLMKQRWAEAKRAGHVFNRPKPRKKTRDSTPSIDTLTR